MLFINRFMIGSFSGDQNLMRPHLIALTCLTLLAAGVQGASTYTVHEDYTMGSVWPVSGPPTAGGALCDADININGVCLTLRGDEVAAEITIDDKLADRLDVTVVFYDARGIRLGIAHHCGMSIEGVQVPVDAARSEVRLTGGPSRCTIGTGLGGTITVTFATSSG